MALHERSEFVKGSAKDTNLDTYTPLRMGNVPEVQVEFVASTGAPVGVGEPANDRGCTSHRQRDLRRARRPSPADPPRGRAPGAYHPGLSRRPCHAD